MRYIALLRGINVGGQKRIKMIDLKIAFESLNFKNVKTYIQSGNVIFDSDSTDTIKLTNQIEKKISETFGFLVKTIIRTDEELRHSPAPQTRLREFPRTAWKCFQDVAQMRLRYCRWRAVQYD